MKTWTAIEIKQKLETDQRWLERAIVAIYKLQTEDEKNSENTKYHNGVGFNSADAHILTYCAKWILSGKPLSGTFLEKAKKKMVKYTKQLETVAQKKAGATVIPSDQAENYLKALIQTKQAQDEVVENAAKVAQVLQKSKNPDSFIVAQFSIQKSQNKEGEVVTTFVQEASSLEGFTRSAYIEIQGKEFVLNSIDRNDEGETQGWNYKSNDGFFALIIND